MQLQLANPRPETQGALGLGAEGWASRLFPKATSPWVAKPKAQTIAWNSGQHYRVILRRGIFYLSQPPRFGLVLAGAYLQ